MQLGQYVDNGNPWHHPHKAINVLCFDGKRRTVRLNLQADSFFSWPGRASIKGKTVSGYITGYETKDGEADLFFCRKQSGDYKFIPKE